MGDIVHCRTGLFGGKLWKCDSCSKECYTYHSCSNRHCPKCSGKKEKDWIQTQKKLMLPCSYYLLTFTLPSQLRPLARQHPKEVYSILMKQAAESLKSLALDSRYLGALPGCIAVLHTWDQKLHFHPHVHFLVPGGGVNKLGDWVLAKNKKFLVPIAALRVIYKAKVRDALDHLKLTDRIEPSVWKLKWVVHAKHAGKGDQVLGYLARYVYRVAISNSRLESFESDEVIFRYQNRKKKCAELCSLSGQEFIRRFLLHVLPPRFHKVRYFGILSPSWRKRIKTIRQTLGHFEEEEQSQDQTDTESTEGTPEEPMCPFCHEGHLRLLIELKRQKRGPPWY